MMAAESVVPKVLEVRDLTVSYGKVDALVNANLSVGAGQIVTVIGPNGAGKTTLLSAVMGVLPSRGEIVLDGATHRSPEVEQMVRAGMTLVPEKRELFAGMSVQDNLLLGAFDRHRRGLRDSARTLGEAYVLFPRLQERREQLAGTLSGGERQMLAIGRALMAAPTLLLLDEPSIGLGPKVITDIFEALRKLNEQGLSILLVEQNMALALEVARRAYVMSVGEITLEGESARLRQTDEVRSIYLGATPRL